MGRISDARGPMPVLPLVRPFAAAAILALVFGRALGPSSAGIGVGMATLTWTIELVGNLLSQLLAMFATVLAIAEILVLLRIQVGAHLQIAAVTVGGVVLLVALTASVTAVPAVPAALIGTAASAMAILAAVDAARAPFARAAAAVVGTIGVASLIRLAAVGTAALARPAWLLPEAVPRGLATGAFVLEALALGLALGWIASRSKRVTTPATVVVLAAAFVITREVMLTNLETAGPAALILRRGAMRLLSAPEPYLPAAVRVFTVVLAPISAAAALFAKGKVPALSGALALALVVGSRAEMPLGAVMLFIAAMALVLGARDERGVWAMIARA